MPGPKFECVQLGSSGPHCTKLADDQHSPAGLASTHAQSSPPLIPTILDLRFIDLVSNPIWWEAETNISFLLLCLKKVY